MGRKNKGIGDDNRGAGEEEDAAATQKRRSSKSSKPRASRAKERSPSRAEEEREARERRKRMRGTPVKRCDANVDSGVTTKILKQVKYYFNSMNKEQSLIDAYAHEGWKGQSREKVRPEKELQRATAQIVRWKLKIRQAIEKLDRMCLEGSIRDSAFDADGQLDYKEIFCAKCHSPDSEVDNDIILCDGFCNRGFHQNCLEPPLATEDIPPGDEGWMCPVCDCKSDCLTFLNERLGTDFEVEMSWEDVFREAVEASTSVADGAAQDLPSEDSEDDDYDPEKQDKEQETLANGEAAGEPDQADSNQDDDDDDDENHSAAESDDNSSDGGSTDLSGEEPLSGAEEAEDEDGDNKKETDEVSGKRRRRNVDYRKLHDEMFGVEYEWEEAFQSEDEDYGPLKRQRKQRSERKVDAGERHQHQNQPDDINDKSKRIPPEAVQRLREAFDHDQLPSRGSKEILAQELGLSYRKVDVWFKNVRTQALRKAKSDAVENETLLTQVGQAQFKLHDLKKTMEALKLSSNAQGFLESSVVDVNRGKRLVYIPHVAEVVEKDSGNLCH